MVRGNRDAVLQYLGKLHPVWIKSAVPDANQRGAFFTQEEARRKGECLTVVVVVNPRKLIEINYRILFPRKNARSFHRGQKPTLHDPIRLGFSPHHDLWHHRSLQQRCTLDVESGGGEEC